MASLKQIIDNLKKSSSEKIKATTTRFMNKEDKKIVALLKAHSPVDSGEFRDNWKAVRPRFGSKNTLAGLLITNATPHYGQFVAFGAEQSKAPWYYPHRDKKTGRFKKGTGKLRATGGKVWAGGLSPGHHKTVGGPIAQVLSKFVDRFTQEYAKEVVKGFV